MRRRIRTSWVIIGLDTTIALPTGPVLLFTADGRSTWAIEAQSDENISGYTII